MHKKNERDVKVLYKKAILFNVLASLLFLVVFYISKDNTVIVKYQQKATPADLQVVIVQLSDNKAEFKNNQLASENSGISAEEQSTNKIVGKTFYNFAQKKTDKAVSKNSYKSAVKNNTKKAFVHIIKQPFVQIIQVNSPSDIPAHKNNVNRRIIKGDISIEVGSIVDKNIVKQRLIAENANLKRFDFEFNSQPTTKKYISKIKMFTPRIFQVYVVGKVLQFKGPKQFNQSNLTTQIIDARSAPLTQSSTKKAMFVSVKNSLPDLSKFKANIMQQKKLLKSQYNSTRGVFGIPSGRGKARGGKIRIRR